MRHDLLFAPRAEIERVQATYLAEMLALARERHGFYRERLVREAITSIGDLARLAPTAKADYMAAPERFVLDTRDLPEEMRMVWDTMYTTGTSAGRPTPFVSTTFDFYRILELQRNMLELRGVRDDDVIANLFPVTRAPHGAWIRVLHAAASRNLRVVSAMPGRPSEHFTVGRDTDAVVRIVASSGATILWGVPSYLAGLIERAGELGADWRAVRRVFVTGEGLSEAARTALVEGLARCGARAQVSISYGSTETQGGFVECAPGSGYHNPAPDQLLVEMLDPNTFAPVPDGAPGLVCITHLRRRGTVLLRYLLGDVSIRTREPCPHCGANTDRLIAMPRRADALLKIKGMLVNPAVLVEALEGVLGARVFQASVAATADAPLARDALVVRVAALEDAALAERAADAVKAAIGVTPEIVFVAADALVDPGEAWKMKKLVDRR